MGAGGGGVGPFGRFNHAKSDMPSGFSMKLRKHIRTQRLEDVRQVGMDRVVDFKFGSGEASNHVILELYASGTALSRSCVCWLHFAVVAKRGDKLKS